ncbi:putative NAD-dependent epimerase/dehydratase family protein [Leucobacter luti]|uniref:Putative NAD-dependent epimerase/dehydratase family protein n=2 Tax=Leucobacter luti TaxID=340320 RepID=A0A4R6S7T2_9MICO|nr:putative NAD-dependent epimerase/dehydratase family protein [Leucobacter luti]
MQPIKNLPYATVRTTVKSAPPECDPPRGGMAVVYCEGQLGKSDGKTANGLVRSSERYDLRAVIDSTHAGEDAGFVLDGKVNGVPVYASLSEALTSTGVQFDYMICGLAPADGMLSHDERTAFLEGIAAGLHLVSGLHEFLNDDPEFIAAGQAANVTITDIRRPKPTHELKMFSGDIQTVTCPRIAVLGTDGSIGKRTTATLLVQALRAQGVNAVLVGTGQTALMQGSPYGVALDAILPQFCSGEVEAQIVAAFHSEAPDVIVIEGQGALSHPAYLSSATILRGSIPDAVIVQHAPHRAVRDDFPMCAVPTVASEIALIEAFSPTRVIGVTINHEGMSDREVGATIVNYERDLGLPTTDPLTRPAAKLASIVLQAFPVLTRSTTSRAG